MDYNQSEFLILSHRILRSGYTQVWLYDEISHFSGFIKDIPKDIGISVLFHTMSVHWWRIKKRLLAEFGATALILGKGATVLSTITLIISANVSSVGEGK